MKLIEDELNAVNEQLSNIYIDNKIILQSLKSFLTGGSKRIRTTVTALYLKSNELEVSADSIKIMTAAELIHNASLLHDDVIDRTKLRRGKSTLAEEFSPYISILAGDYLLSIATELLMQINNPKVLEIFLNCTKQMCNSEINQFFLRGKAPDLKEYIEICRGKTAALFEALLESCALIEGAPAQKAKEFAEHFGILFQLKNDLDSASAKTDAENEIFTPKDFLGIEKTIDLMDNYQRKLQEAVCSFPDNIYKKGTESLLSKL